MQKIKKILIIGAKGMLGQDLVKIFSTDKNYDVISLDLKNLDITSKDDVFGKIGDITPEIIINAAAFTNVDGCEDEAKKDLCMKVNGEALGYLASCASQINSILVHYSTDYVFNGKKSEGYKEDEKEINPVNFYGKSKALGEKKLQENTKKFYLIRTSWLYGKGGKNFVDTMLKLAETKKELKVVDDQHGKPTYTVDLAKRTKELVDKNLPYGIYHITNEGETTWFKFAKKFFELAGVNVKIKPCASREFPRPARRPTYSSLINTKLSPSRPWGEALSEYLRTK
jgi:dTDP-4-dehydrorhamnose reductase